MRRPVCGILLGVLSMLVFAACAAGEEAPDAPKATTQSAPLARYYGFGPMEILKLDWGLGAPLVVDVNGDGLNDMVVVNNRKARIDILLQKPGFTAGAAAPVEIRDEDVNDLFGREINWRFKRVAYDLNVAAGQPVAADLNGDGRVDIAYAASDGLRVVLQAKPAAEAATGDGPVEPAWLPARKIDANGVLAAGDLNGDGRTDLALLDAKVARVFSQKADGSLGQPAKYHNAGENVRRVWIADFDGDGRDDMIIQSRDEKFPILVRFQNAEGALGPLVRYEAPSPRAMEVDALGASAARLMTISGRSGRFRVSALERGPEPVEYPVFTYPLPASDASDHRDTVVADVDGDGLDDVVVSDPARAEFLLLRADAKTGLAAPRRFPGLADMRTLAAGDLDGSGRQAVVALSVKEKIIAVSRWTKGRLSYPVSLPVAGEPVAMDLADVDGDGKLDLLYVTHEKADRKFFLRTILSVGRPEAAPGAELHMTVVTDKPRRLIAADVDHDGRVDAMVVRSYGPMLLVRQAADGTFAQELRKAVHSGLVDNIDAAALAPLGPEGGAALLLAKKNFARAVVFDADAGWSVVDQYPAEHDTSVLTAAAAFPLDGGAAPAVVTYDTARRKLAVLLAGDDGAYRTDREIEAPAVTAKKILVGSFGGPAGRSVLLCGTRKLVLVPLRGRQGAVRKLASFEATAKDAWFGAAAAGDLNGDGAPEIVLCDQGRRYVEILAFDAAGSLTAASRFKVFETPPGGGQGDYQAGSKRRQVEPRAVRVADVTGDGAADLILLVHDRIIVYPQDSLPARRP